jgi:hypothetical protein
MIGIGSSKIMASVAIENPALAYQFIVMLIHVPGIDLSHARATGVHWNIAAAVDAMPYDNTMASMIQQMMRNAF